MKSVLAAAFATAENRQVVQTVAPASDPSTRVAAVTVHTGETLVVPSLADPESWGSAE